LAKLYEVEVKVPLLDEKSVEKILVDAGGQRLNSEIQTDMYFDHPCRSFSQTDEAIRLRSRTPLDDVPGLSSEYAQIELTYKGPKVDKRTKTRLEFTSGVSDFEAVAEILRHTGFKYVATIRKRRVFFDIEGITTSIDDIEGIGLFLELEAIAKGEEKMQVARTKLLSLVKRLGFDPRKMVRESYLEIYLSRQS
jgi:adenylate cyclase class 2